MGFDQVNEEGNLLRLAVGSAALPVTGGLGRFAVDRTVVVGDGLLRPLELGVGPGPLEIEPRTLRIEADRNGAIGNGFLGPVQMGVIKTAAGPACRAST